MRLEIYIRNGLADAEAVVAEKYRFGLQEDSESDSLVQYFDSLSMSHARQPQIYVQFGSIEYIQEILVKYVDVVLFSPSTVVGYFNFHKVFPLMEVTFPDLSNQSHDLGTFIRQFKIDFYQACLVHTLIECLMKLRLKIPDQELVDAHLAPFRLDIFGQWNLRNLVDKNCVNNILPNSIYDILTLPFALKNFRFINDAYIYNCLVHFISYPTDIRHDFKLIWLDKPSFAILKELIYFEVLKKVDAGFPKNGQSYKYFALRSFDLSAVFRSQEQCFTEAIDRLKFHSIRNPSELLEVLCFFYDLELDNYVNKQFSDELFRLVLSYFSLTYIPTEVIQTYRNRCCSSYLNILRNRKLFLDNKTLADNFSHNILALESHTDRAYHHIITPDKPSGYRNECLARLTETGLQDNQVDQINQIGYFEYIIYT